VVNTIFRAEIAVVRKFMQNGRNRQYLFYKIFNYLIKKIEMRIKIWDKLFSCKKFATKMFITYVLVFIFILEKYINKMFCFAFSY